MKSSPFFFIFESGDKDFVMGVTSLFNLEFGRAPLDLDLFLDKKSLPECKLDG